MGEDGMENSWKAPKEGAVLPRGKPIPSTGALELVSAKAPTPRLSWVDTSCPGSLILLGSGGWKLWLVTSEQIAPSSPKHLSLMQSAHPSSLLTPKKRTSVASHLHLSHFSGQQDMSSTQRQLRQLDGCTASGVCLHSHCPTGDFPAFFVCVCNPWNQREP